MLINFVFVFFQVPNLCSHMYALCFTAQSLFDYKHKMYAKRCSKVCPHLGIFQISKLFHKATENNVTNHISDNEIPESILIGMNMPRR